VATTKDLHVVSTRSDPASTEVSGTHQVHWGTQRLLPETFPRADQLHNRLILRRWRGAFDTFKKDLFLEEKKDDAA